MLINDPRWHEYVERCKTDYHHSDEIKHELWPPIVYPPNVNDIPRTIWAHSRSCAVTDEYGRQCVREAGHDYECVIPPLHYYFSGGKNVHDYD